VGVTVTRFYRSSDLKDEYQWLAEIIWCSLVGYHTKFACLRCSSRKGCRFIEPRLRTLKLEEVLKEGVPLPRSAKAEKRAQERKREKKKRKKAEPRSSRKRGRPKSKKALEIKGLLEEGKSPREVAEQLGVSINYVYLVRKNVGDGPG